MFRLPAATRLRLGQRSPLHTRDVGCHGQRVVHCVAVRLAVHGFESMTRADGMCTVSPLKSCVMNLANGSSLRLSLSLSLSPSPPSLAPSLALALALSLSRSLAHSLTHSLTHSLSLSLTLSLSLSLSLALSISRSVSLSPVLSPDAHADN